MNVLFKFALCRRRILVVSTDSVAVVQFAQRQLVQEIPASGINRITSTGQVVRTFIVAVDSLFQAQVVE